MRRLIGVWLMVDGVYTGLWFAMLSDSLGMRGAGTAAAMIVRVLIGALAALAGWLISQRRAPGRPLGRLALLALGTFALVDAWWGLLPTNLDPSFRWPAAWAQAALAGGAMLFLRSDT